MSKQTHNHKSRRFRRFFRSNKAVSALEYAVLVGVIAGAIGIAIATFGGQITKAMSNIGKQVKNTSVQTIQQAPSVPQPF